jgi:cation diffusion facilitator CzcD-associated flavoprotein CzcO
MEERHISIVGCGFGGLAMGVKLLKAGHKNFTIFEKADGVGGTWRDNTYPDCGCDVPSMLYSLSFELYPEWDRMWAKQSQILEYIEFIVDKYGLREHIELSTMVKRAVWNNDNCKWEVATICRQITKVVDSDYIVMANGTLHVPAFPAIKGVSTVDGKSEFQGESFHAAQWNHKYSYKNKRVGVIGTGASAIQLVPEIAKDVKELYVFQRTPSWIFYKTDFVIPSCVKSLFRIFPCLMRLFRYAIYIGTEARFGGLYHNSFFNWWMRVDALRYIRQSVADPELREKVTPNYVMGCKRMLFSSHWYPAICRDNVYVITERIAGVTRDGVAVYKEDAVSSGTASSNAQGTSTIDLDLIVYATGFSITREDIPEQFAFEVIGRDGASLSKWMIDGPSSLLGIAAENFPNMFFVYGPNTNLGHNSIIFMMECQVNYIIQLMRRHNRSGGGKFIEVKAEAVREFQERTVSTGLKGKVSPSLETDLSAACLCNCYNTSCFHRLIGMGFVRVVVSLACAICC